MSGFSILQSMRGSEVTPALDPPVVGSRSSATSVGASIVCSGSEVGSSAASLTKIVSSKSSVLSTIASAGEVKLSEEVSGSYRWSTCEREGQKADSRYQIRRGR
jgi:hypothetical protein